MAGVISGVIIAFLLRTRLVALFLDAPDQRKQHQNAVPRLGGFGIIIACLFIWAQLPLNSLHFALAIGGLGILVIGLLDDSSLPHYLLRFWHKVTKNQKAFSKFELRVRYKLIMEFALAAATAHYLNLVPAVLHFGGHILQLGVWAFPLVVFWIVVVMNAFNLVDGIDGLAGSLSVLSLSTIAGMAYLLGMPQISAVAIALICATIGFLIHNFSPARVFLGDMGSLFLGYCVAVLGLFLLQNPRGPISAAIIPLLVGLPLLDVAVSIVRRFGDVPTGSGIITRFQRIVSADSNHLHHRLLYLGLSHLRSTFILCGLSALILLCSFGFVRLDSWDRWLLVAYTFVAVSMIIYSVYNRDSWENMQRRFNRFLRNHGAKPFRLAVVSGSADTLEALLGSDEHPFELISITREQLGNIYRNVDGLILEQEETETDLQFSHRVFSLGASFAYPIAAIANNPEPLASNPLASRWEDRLTIVGQPLDAWPMLAQLLGQVVRMQNPGPRLLSKIIGF